jgi:hypothetical protein
MTDRFALTDGSTPACDISIGHFCGGSLEGISEFFLTDHVRQRRAKRLICAASFVRYVLQSISSTTSKVSASTPSGSLRTCHSHISTTLLYPARHSSLDSYFLPSCPSFFPPASLSRFPTRPLSERPTTDTGPQTSSVCLSTNPYLFPDASSFFVIKLNR